MKGDPLDVLEEDESARDQQLAKVLYVDTLLGELAKLDPRVLEKVDRVGRVHVLPVSVKPSPASV